jgi:polyhydroxyalkanoate synthesis regulator phasin
MDEPARRRAGPGPTAIRDPSTALGASSGRAVDEAARAARRARRPLARRRRCASAKGTRHRLRDLFRELGLVTRDDWDELELRVAQLEHRLSRLLEDEKP